MKYKAILFDMDGTLLPMNMHHFTSSYFKLLYRKLAKHGFEAAKVQKGSGEPNRKKVASITWDQVKTIAEEKMPDLNAFTIQSAMKMVAGTARSMGIKVTGEFPENI